ncbi:MAG: DUF4446 family protein [Microgenomates group bacterium]
MEKLLIGGEIFLLIWLVFLTFFLFKTVNHYKKLTEGVEKKDLKSVLEKILSNLKYDSQRINEVIKTLNRLEKENLKNIQKIGLVRFNPFADTGGNQSFSLALLDGEDNGLVISSLHSREITRIYAKPVKNGKGVNYQLSTEEMEAIKNARKIKK